MPTTAVPSARCESPVSGWRPTGAGLIAFLIGGVLEQNAIATYDNFGGPGPWIADGVAVLLWCAAAYQRSRRPRRRPTADVGPGLPQWQGYCIALLSLAWLALAAVTWFLTEIKSPTFTLAMIGAAIGHLVAGTAVVRRTAPKRPAV